MTAFPNNPKPAEMLSLTNSADRRTVLKAGAVALGLGALATKVVPALAAQTAATATPTTCVLLPELTEGPYFVANQLMRADITEGVPGIPLTLKLAVQDVTSCGPLANAAVDIWHCDASGVYSGISGENPGGGSESTGAENAETTFLRGVQLTNDDGVAEFTTIYPGWYTGRTVHIHMMVTVGGAPGEGDPAGVETTGEIYLGGHTSHTGQLFFDDALSDVVYQTEAYARTGQRMLNGEDNILADHLEEPGFMVEITQISDTDLSAGLVGTILIGVDPSATPSPNQDGGGGAPGGDPPGGEPPPNG